MIAPITQMFGKKTIKLLPHETYPSQPINGTAQAFATKCLSTQNLGRKARPFELIIDK